MMSINTSAVFGSAHGVLGRRSADPKVNAGQFRRGGHRGCWCLVVVAVAATVAFHAHCRYVSCCEFRGETVI